MKANSSDDEPSSEKPISPEFERFRKFLSLSSGITLADNKSYLVDSRLKSILAEQGLPNLDLLLNFLDKNPQSPLISKVINAMTTNETFWFRDHHFYHYVSTKLLPQLFESTKQGQRIDIWSAASSSGQEAYSFNMLVEQCVETLRPQNVQPPPVYILGTDISSAMIEQAKEAVYTPLELSRGLSEAMLMKYFDKCSDDKASLKDVIRKRVQFKLHNLMESFDTLGFFDVILCRNALIYFDDEMVTDILQRMHKVLKPNGVLFLSSSETIKGMGDLYKAEPTNPGFLYRAIK